MRYTLEEIQRQPVYWEKMIALAQAHREELAGMLEDFLGRDGEIVLTGAGSSEYVGKALAPYLNRHIPWPVRSCGTTDLVTAPENYIRPQRNTVLVSFARSGDSPESLGAIQAAEAVSSRLRQVILTCNPEGRLAKLGAQRAGYFVLQLPPETNDQGFAMTNSFTSMYVLALLSLVPMQAEAHAAAVRDLAEAGTRFLHGEAQALPDWTGRLDYRRIIYLGANALKGLAQESALKMLELTRGQVATLFDTPVGFRHGPKSFVNNETLTVLCLSDDPFARQYELDLLSEMSRERGKNRLLVLCGQPCGEAEALADRVCCFGNAAPHENGLLVPEFVLAAQMIALQKSLSLGIDPDDPNPAGVVNRVVKGVTIYPYRRGMA